MQKDKSPSREGVARNGARRGRVILGIDPGYAILGWGVISDGKHLAHGIIQTYPTDEMGQRLAYINRELTAIIKKHQPTDIAIEEVFFGKNAKTAIKVSHARGVCLLCAVEHTGKIYEYKPAQVKQAVVGVGNANKNQIQSMVQKILNLKEIPKPDDAADALAIAITHSAYYR